VAFAQQNAALNGVGDRVRAVALDVAAPARAFAAAGLAAGSAKRVLMNPPFNDPARQKLSPDPRRRAAHAAPNGTLAAWVRRADTLLAAGGTLSLIWRADGLADVLAALGRGFGGIAILPVHPRPDAAAIRILVRAAKGSRAPLAILPGLTLNDAEGRPAAEAEAVLRGGATTALARL
jgi:tRNA1(Val) A37 N6-methylase TrmN6